MKYRLLIVVTVLYLWIALPTSAQTTSTPTASNSLVTASDIYVRGGPGASYLPVGRLVAGDIVLPLNRSDNGVWVMIQYNRGYGWIRRDLADWVEDIDSLPTLEEPDLTPTALLTVTPTPASTGVLVNAGAEGAFVRFGPGVTYPFLGAIVTGDIVEPVGRNVDGDWLLIRFRGGFGWIARNLVEGSVDLSRLPVLLPDALTPSATFTASITPTPTTTNTPSNTPTATPTLIPTNTPLPATSPVPTNTATQRPPPTNTRTLTPTDVPTRTPLPPSSTLIPTNTPPSTDTDTPTPLPTATLSRTPTETPLPSSTPTAAPTDTSTPTAAHTTTNTASPTVTHTPPPTDTASPTEEPTEVAALVVATHTPVPPSSSPTTAPTNTLQPTDTSSPTHTPTRTPSSTPSATPTMTTAAAIAAPTSVPTTSVLVETPAPEPPPVQPEVVVGVVLLVLVVGYVALYWRALTIGERYAEGFVIERCPACERGHLTVETRPARVLGIPRPQAIVRCDNCRSVLREVGKGRWRYAVDRAANLTLYNQLNGRIVTEDMLRTLDENAPREVPPVRPPARPPTFVDDED